MLLRIQGESVLIPDFYQMCSNFEVRINKPPDNLATLSSSAIGDRNSWRFQGIATSVTKADDALILTV